MKSLTYPLTSIRSFIFPFNSVTLNQQLTLSRTNHINILSINSDYLGRLKTLYISRGTNINFLLTISIQNQEKTFTLLAESLQSFLDKLGKRKRLCRHLQTPLICRSSRDLDESDKFHTAG